ncbi:hypothetical protein ACSR0Z_32835 [Streptomyces viridosporus]
MPAPYPQELRKAIVTWIESNAPTTDAADSHDWAIATIEFETAMNHPTATLAA